MARKPASYKADSQPARRAADAAATAQPARARRGASQGGGQRDTSALNAQGEGAPARKRSSTGGKVAAGQAAAAGKGEYAGKSATTATTATFKRRRKQLSLARAAEPLISQALRARGHATLEVIRRWPHIVGAELAAASEPVELKMRGKMRTEGVLTVRVESGFAVLFEHRKPYLIDRINSYFGFQAVSQINLKQGPMRRRSPQAKALEMPTPDEKAAVEQLVSPVHDDGLKATLARLGQMVYARSRKAG